MTEEPSPIKVSSFPSMVRIQKHRDEILFA